MSFYSITASHGAWIIIYLIAFIAPWLIVRALPAKRPPPPPPPPPVRLDALPPAPTKQSDIPDWLTYTPDWLRNPPDWLPKDAYTPPSIFILSHRARRIFRMKQNGGAHTRVEWLALCALYNHRCLCCRRKRPLTKDHVIPVVFGGSDDIDNLQPLCQSCNSRKHTEIIDYRPPHKRLSRPS